MKEVQGTTREHRGRADLELDDIIIEDISGGAREAAVEDTAATDVPQEIQVEELSHDSISIIEETDAGRITPSGQAGAAGIADLESLTSEINQIRRVAPVQRNASRMRTEEPSLPLDDFDDVRELNLDDIITKKEAGAAPSDTSARAKEKQLPAAAAELPLDLIDDEFIILEEEHGEPVSLTVAEGTSVTGHDAESMADELVSIGDAGGIHPGSIIDENLDAGEKASVSPAVEEKPVVKPAPPRKAGEITIQIPEKVRKNLPGNFRISDLRPVDLFEAEKIASEDMLLLKEEDLVEELDAIDLVPLDEEPHAGEIPPFEEEPVAEVEEQAIMAESETPAAEEAVEAMEEPAPPVEKSAAAVVKEMPAAFEEPRDIVDESEARITTTEVKKESPSKPILLEEEAADETAAAGESVERAIEIRELAEETETKAAVEPVVPQVKPSDEPVRFEAGQIHAAESRMIVTAPAPGIEEVARILVKETLPANLAAIRGGKNVYIIDDLALEKEIERSESIFEENDLEKITSGMVEVVEGDSKFLREASTEEDQDQIAAIMSGTALAFEDLLIDFEDEYKFSDEETGFIDSAFISDAYREHDRTATGPAAGRARRKETIALEIFGLTDHEITDIESGVFIRDFKDIDLSRVSGAARPGLDQAPEDYNLTRKYLYLGNSAQNMNKAEKASVEEDLSDAEAVIFEENADDIRRILANYRKGRKAPAGGVRDISDEIVIIEESGDVERFAGTVPEEKRKNIKSLLKYLDGLFEKLPEDVIRKFADSEYYNLYVKVLNELDR